MFLVPIQKSMVPCKPLFIIFFFRLLFFLTLYLSFMICAYRNHRDRYLPIKISWAKSDEIFNKWPNFLPTKFFADEYLLPTNIFYLRNYLVSNCWKIPLSINPNTFLRLKIYVVVVKKFQLKLYKQIMKNNQKSYGKK